MSVQTEVVQSRFELDGNQPLNELGKLEAKASEVRNSLKGMKKNSDEYVAAAKQLKEVNALVDAQREKLGLTGMTYRQLTSMQRELTREMKNGATAGTEGYEKLAARLREVNDVLAKQKSAYTTTKSMFEQMKSQIGGVAIGTIVGQGIQSGMQQVLDLIPKYISGIRQIAKEEAQVQKTTNLTDAQMKLLNEQFKNMDTITPRSELRALAVEAGKLGKESVKDIAEFVRQADIINVALGQDLGEGAVTEIGKISDIYQVEMLNIASAVNEVGASSKASEAYQVDFLKRLSGVAPIAQLSASAIMSYGSTLENNGQQAEMASTALNGFFTDFIKNTEQFGKQAGFAKGELSKLLQDRGTNEAFVQFLERLKSSSKSTEDLLFKLQALGIDGARGSNVLLTLANSTAMIRDQFNVASQAIQGTDSVMKEFNKNSQNADGAIEKITQRLAKKFTFEGLNDGIKSLAINLERLTRTEVSETLQMEQARFNVLADAVMNTNNEFGVRNSLIDELRALYPQYLQGLSNEEISNKKLQEILVDVNKEYAKKIFLQQQEEKMTEFMRQEMEATQALIQAQKDLAAAKKTNITRVGPGGEVVNDDDAMAQRSIDNMKARITEIKNMRAQFIREQQELAKAMGIDMSAGKTGPKTETTATPLKSGGPEELDEKEKKKLEAMRKAHEKALEELRRYQEEVNAILKANDIEIEQSLLSRTERELAVLDQKYMAEIEKTEGFIAKTRANKSLSDAEKEKAENEFQAKIYQINLDWIEAKRIKEEELKAQEELKKQELQQKIELELMSEGDREIAQIRMKYEALISEAEKYGLATTAIYEAMYNAISAARDKQAKREQKIDQKALKDKRAVLQAEIDAYNATANVMGNAIAFLGQIGEENSGFAKALTIAQIAIDTAAAIASVVKNAEANPTNAITGGAAAVIQTGAGIARVFAGMNSARQSLNTEIPSAPSIQDWNPDINLTGRYFGGFTGSGTGRGPADQYGEIVGYHHRNEYVAPSFIMHEPAAINAVRVLERLRMNAIATGQTNTSGPAPEFGGPNSSGESQMMAMMMQMMEAIKAQGEKPVMFVATDYERFQEEQNKIKFKSQR